ncbi:MAG TPA: GAF domain-containing SpoIIE family protein phosphatase [Blastocatellia bacterium]|nr:GAF domain-containing SpoIIE family protein phosphatase [Blastocatellia bacterium]
MAVHEKTIETLIDAVRKVSGSLDLDIVLDTIFDSIKELIDYSAAIVCVVDLETGAIRDLKAHGYPTVVVAGDLLAEGEGIIGWVIKHRRGQIINDVKRDARYVKARPQTRSEIAAPIIRYDGRTLGVINLEADWVDGYDHRDLELLTMFASLAASAIDHTLLYQRVMRQRRAESELELARKVVDSLLPRAVPVVEGFDIAGLTSPVREVGGDYFDFIESVTDRLGVLVADVSGKGLAAALIMVAFRAYIHATVINELAMRVVMARVNRLIYETTEGERYITTFYGLIDPENKRLLYINAGHNPPLLLRADGTTRLLDKSSLPVGVFEDSRYSEAVVDFLPGDILVLYTDGVTEAMNIQDESFGVERLEKTVRASGDFSAQEICQTVAAAVREFSSEVGGPEDDLTISIIKVTR